MFPKSIGKACKTLTDSLIESQYDTSKSQNSWLALVRNEYMWWNWSKLLSKSKSLGMKTCKSSFLLEIQLIFPNKAGKIYARGTFRFSWVLKFWNGL